MSAAHLEHPDRESLSAYALAGLSVYAIARALQLSPAGSWAATLAYLSTPALVYAATGTKNDPFVAAIFLFLAALILHLRRDLAREGDVPMTAYAILALMGLTYAMGTKAYTLQLAAGLLVLMVVPGLGAGNRSQMRRGKEQSSRDWRLSSRGRRIVLLALAACAVFLGGYWNVRNWALKGNPFYPYEVALEAQGSVATGSGHYGLGLERLGDNLRVLGEKFGDKHSRIVPDLPETTGWGWFVYSLGLVASAWALVFDRRFRWLAAGFGVAALALMASNTTSPWNMRYFIWLPALFAIGFGIFIDPIGEMEAWRRRLW
jgi:hypothetical protein